MPLRLTLNLNISRGSPKLYRALELGEGASQLSRLYRGLGWPDSARKYEALETADDWGSLTKYLPNSQRLIVLLIKNGP